MPPEWQVQQMMLYLYAGVYPLNRKNVRLRTEITLLIWDRMFTKSATCNLFLPVLAFLKLTEDEIELEGMEKKVTFDRAFGSDTDQSTIVSSPPPAAPRQR